MVVNFLLSLQLQVLSEKVQALKGLSLLLDDLNPKGGLVTELVDVLLPQTLVVLL